MEQDEDADEVAEEDAAVEGALAETVVEPALGRREVREGARGRAMEAHGARPQVVAEGGLWKLAKFFLGRRGPGRCLCVRGAAGSTDEGANEAVDGEDKDAEQDCAGDDEDEERRSDVECVLGTYADGGSEGRNAVA